MKPPSVHHIDLINFLKEVTDTRIFLKQRIKIHLNQSPVSVVSIAQQFFFLFKKLDLLCDMFLYLLCMRNFASFLWSRHNRHMEIYLYLFYPQDMIFNFKEFREPASLLNSWKLPCYLWWKILIKYCKASWWCSIK